MSTLTLSYVVNRAIGKMPGSSAALVIESSLGELDQMVREISQAIGDAESPSGQRLRQDLREQIRWLLHGTYIEARNDRGAPSRPNHHAPS